MASQFSFSLLAHDSTTAARRSVFCTPHGEVQMPAFMPVGTLGTVKGLTIDMVRATGAQMVLSNTYHLALRPGDEVVRHHGGLHNFMLWDGPILTDSGGFQVFSLASQRKITEQSAMFRSHIDGSLLDLSPEKAIQIQENLGSDVAMVLDHVVELPSPKEVVRDACERSIRWAKRCQEAATRDDQAQFAIVQGGLDPEMRVWCAGELAKLNFPGYAIGGLSVGETPEAMYAVLDAVMPAMPVDKPRYLMGVGRPIDLLEAIRRGVDLFDCVLPTRNGRNAQAFTDQGPIRLRNNKYQLDREPLDPHCPCPACRHSKGYIRHLFIAGEMLGPMLLTAHNITYYQRLMAEARAAIEAGEFETFYQRKKAGWTAAGG
ncbi:queuine tRNA-ribosyltransferase [Pirellula staleyi DSM 6068]|uniref:Queuine tRNA-ribosyltransferase n=1 Tax=Pirellula staleyi (strain ATCC 27377 / DSM 6068 / ICPB 4128) TaxID=530564 RepID=D2R233_PIRSD|nr:tRNA guanosine(34) transglycosylase Tgt [Pirellula staleyi]ADB18644.1 queuine tRNA-ribosyltransferase [Pirellula staleyi DSM 6068]